MKNNWEFDKEYITNLLTRVQKILNDKFISKKRRECLKIDESAFKSFLKDDYSLAEEKNEYADWELEDLIDVVLKKMKYYYRIFGPKLINWVIELNKSKIFKNGETTVKTNLSIDEQAEMTIKNYEANSNILLPEAKELIYNTSQIHSVLDDEIESYCYNAQLINLPFIIVNPSGGPHDLNHEVQHGLEHILCYNQNDLYGELGSQLFEILFLDLLSDKNGYLHSGDFDYRFDDMNLYLEDMFDFFLLIKEFSKKNFKVSYEEFIDTCEKISLISKDKLKEYLVEEILDDCGLAENMNYVFSYLKALEIRDKNLFKKKDALLILNKYLKHKKFVFDINSNAFNIYNNYVEDMYSRVRKP